MRKNKLLLAIVGLLLGLATPGWAQTDFTTATTMERTSETTTSVTGSDGTSYSVKTTGWQKVGNGNGPGAFTDTGAGAFTVSDVNENSAYPRETYGATDASHHIQQTLTGLENGVYEVQLYAASLNAWSGGSLSDESNEVSYIYAVSNGVELKTFIKAKKGDTYTDAGYTQSSDLGPYKISDINVTNGELTFGLGSAQEGKTNWLTVQIYSVKRTGDLTTMTLNEDVSSYEGTVPTAVYNNLVSVAKANNGDYTDVEKYNTAAAAIKTAKEAADALVSNYAAWLAMYNEAKTAVEATGSYTDADDAASTLTSALSTQNTTVGENAEITADAISTSTTAIQDAFKTFIKAVTVTGSIEITNAYMTNPSFETGDMTGWSVGTSGDDTGVRSTTNATFAMENSDGAWLFNTWAPSIKTLDLKHDQITGLPKGKYTVKGVFAGYKDASTIDLTANSVTSKLDMSNNTAATVGYENSVQTNVTSAGTLDISVSNTGLGLTFFKADKFQLYYDETGSDIELTITVDNASMTEYDKAMPEYTYAITDAAGNTYEASEVLTTEPTTKATYTYGTNTTDVTTGSAAGTYDIVASDAVAADGYSIASYEKGTLTITAKNYSSITENLDFSQGDALTENVTTYERDAAKNGTTRYNLQTVPGWESSLTGSGDYGAAGGLVAYGSSTWIGGNTNSVPEGDEEHTGNALAILAVWGATATYSTTTTLPAGQVTITIPVYNMSGTESITNLISVKVGNETKTSSNTTYTVGSWTKEVFTFQLDEESEATITLGYTGTGGNGAMPHLFFDKVEISSKPIVTITAADVTADEFEGFEDKLTYTATDVDGNTVTLDTEPTLTATASYGSTANAGSDNGTYTITPSGAAKDGYEIVYKTGTLTIKEADYSSITENLDFTKGYAIEDGICTYAKNRGDNDKLVTRSGLQPVAGWTGNDEDADAHAGGMVAINSGTWVGGTDYVTPTTNSDGESDGNVLGIMSVWNTGTGTPAIYTTKVNLPAGTYTLTIPVYNSGNTSNTITNKIGYQIGEEDAVYATATTYAAEWTEEKFEFTLSDVSDVTISLGLGWTGGSGKKAAPCLFFDAITLAKNITLDETADDTETLTANDGKAANVTLKRTINENVYNAICLPFDVDKETIAKVFGEGAEVAKYNGDTYNSTTGNMSIDFTKSETIEAGVPYLIYSENAYTTENPLTFEGVTISSTLKSVTTGENYDFVGNFATGQAVAQYDVIISAKGNLSVRKTATTLKGYRSFFQAKSENAQKARSIDVNIGGETTSINSISGLETESGDIYNLRGQKVNTAQKGVYIQNGKKVVIK